MKLSVIVPVYNMMADGKLQNCLDSLMRQEIADMEVIAVDDKSTDDSLALLEQYSARYGERFITIASPENGRQGAAKNLGMKRARGEWIGFIDSDDWIASDMFAKLLAKAEETGADVVGCDYLLTDAIGKETGVVVENNTMEQTGLLGEAQYRSLVLEAGSMVVKIYKRTLFTENQIVFPEKMFYEDNAIGALPMLHATHFERVPEPLYFYYQNPNSTVHTVSVERCEDRMRAMEIFVTECKNRGFYDKYAKEINYKVFELGYKNTLFSYLQTTGMPSLKYVTRMRDFLLENAPDYKGELYAQMTDAENKKLVDMHMRSPFLFLVYYKALNGYRKIRKKLFK